ncbi:MAG: tRNA pseudouridine(54/55) synthase Pus10 [Thermoprotei archaeon]|nr:MAG: tRNA pseudouridine(54/55) synthase Pus10 [Thermoprotei archaeon]
MAGEDIIGKSIEILKRYNLCDSCLGRQFALLGSGLTNRERGRAIKTILLMKAFSPSGSRDETMLKLLCESNFEPALRLISTYGIQLRYEVKPCYLCSDFFKEENLEKWVKKILDKINGIEFESFQVGCRLNPSLLTREEDLRTLFKLEYGESLKTEINRELGKRIHKVTGKHHNAKSPDLLIIVDLTIDDVVLEVKPLYIYGRYRKLVRGIPQNIWFCPHCWGKGCQKCKGTGRLYPESIEEYISIPLVEAAKGTGYKFHGAGREDVDVRTLGSGRPFVVEIKNPRKRKINLNEILKRINENAKGKVEVLLLKFSDKKTVRRIKKLAEISAKTYRALVVFKGIVKPEKLKELEDFFKNKVVSQRTPKRVLHRRADKIRKKTVFNVKTKQIADNIVEFMIKCQGGLYVKELITGDEGRTEPNFSEFLGLEVESITLDVMGVED